MKHLSDVFRTRKQQDKTLVFVVEDEARLRDLLTEEIAEFGYRVLSARSAEEALRAMEWDRPDIVLLDLHLPGMDGLQCFSEIDRRWPEISVVILTGLGTLAAAQSAIRLGVVEFLTKPVSLGDLELALNRAWQRVPPGSEGSEIHAGRSAIREVDKAIEGPRFTLRETERQMILDAVSRHKGNRMAAAAELGISERKLYYRLAEYERSARPLPEAPKR